MWVVGWLASTSHVPDRDDKSVVVQGVDRTGSMQHMCGNMIEPCLIWKKVKDYTVQNEIDISQPYRTF